jgi:hypothetical protein
MRRRSGCRAGELLQPIPRAVVCHAADGGHAIGRPPFRRPVGRSLGGRAAALGGPCPRNARRVAAARRRREAIAGRKGRLRDLPPRVDQVALVGREYASLRGRPAGLQRLYQRQHLPAPDAVDPAEGRAGVGLHRPDEADRQDRRRREGKPPPAAAHAHGNGHPAEPRRHRVLPVRAVRRR